MQKGYICFVYSIALRTILFSSLEVLNILVLICLYICLSEPQGY